MHGRNKRVMLCVLIATVAIGFLYSVTMTSLVNTMWEMTQNIGIPRTQDTLAILSDEQEDRVDILLCTYMRSGSTFVGKILGWKEDAFYWYEPFWKHHVWYYFREGGKYCDYLKPTCKNGTQKMEKAVNFLSDIYDCNLANNTEWVGKNLPAHESLSGPSWKSFRKCKNSKNTTLRGCMVDLESVCRNATYKMTKVLRLDVSYASRLLDKHPRLKVVLLLRDPRGVMSSHLKEGWIPVRRNDKKSLENDMTVLCSRMNRDIEALKTLRIKYGHRVRIIQYEDFDVPVEKGKALYRYLGLKLSQNDTQLLYKLSRPKRNITQNNRKPDSDPFRYRQSLDWDIVKIMENYCKDVYQKLGLIQYKSKEQYQNMSISGINQSLTYSLG